MKLNITLNQEQRRSIGEKIKEARLKHPALFKQEILAAEINCNVKTISRAENGGDISVETLFEISQKLELVLPEFLMGKKLVNEISKFELLLDEEISSNTHDILCDSLELEDYELIEELVEFLENRNKESKLSLTEKIKQEKKIKKLCDSLKENDIKIFIETIKDSICYITKKMMNIETDWFLTEEEIKNRIEEEFEDVEKKPVYGGKFHNLMDKKILHFYKANSNKINQLNESNYILVKNKDYSKLIESYGIAIETAEGNMEIIKRFMDNLKLESELFEITDSKLEAIRTWLKSDKKGYPYATCEVLNLIEKCGGYLDSTKEY
ncbi:MAG: helix-turn-helix domain-containing protein [Fusobacteriaceae bacterium]